MMAAVLGWAFINVLLRPRVRVSQNIVIGQAFGRGPRAQVKIVNRGIATLTNVVPEAWVAVREAGERQLLRLSATSPMLPHLGSRRPKRYRRDSVTALPQRILTLELPSDPDPRLVEWAGAEGGMTFEKGNQALAAALSRRVDYELILTIEATDSLTGVRALAALTSFSTTNVCRGKFARGTSVDVEPEINTEESPSVTEHDAPASTQIVNVAGILRDLNMEDALTTEEKAEIARRAADELTDRVGSRLAAGLTKTQMDEFEAFTDRRELEAERQFFA